MKKEFPRQFFVSGIGTDVGKTLVSAVMVKALNAHYWKPVQSGSEMQTDRNLVQSLVPGNESRFHPEAYSLRVPASPHFAAADMGVEIDLQQIQLPDTGNHRLVVEGAGGLMVPLNHQALVVDLISHLQLPVILVARNYLGSINHTLLSIELLKSRGLELAGLIFSGNNFLDNEEIIHHFSGVPVIGRVAEAGAVDASFITEQAEQMRRSLSLFFEL